MNLRMKQRIENGTAAQQRAMLVAALATKIISLKQNTRLNAQQRLELLRFLATR